MTTNAPDVKHYMVWLHHTSGAEAITHVDAISPDEAARRAVQFMRGEGWTARKTDVKEEARK